MRLTNDLRGSLQMIGTKSAHRDIHLKRKDLKYLSFIVTPLFFYDLADHVGRLELDKITDFHFSSFGGAPSTQTIP